MIKYIAPLLLATILITDGANAKRTQHESYYQKKDCLNKNGIAEFRLKNNRRVDCLTPELAIEHDFQYKVFECLGQALYYGYATNRKGVCALIVKNKNSREYKILKDLVGKPLILGGVYEIQEELNE